MEGKILCTLSFNITTTSSYVFLERFAKILGVDKKTYFMARYLLELALVEYGMLKYSARNIAASSLYLSCKIIKFTTCKIKTILFMKRLKMCQFPYQVILCSKSHKY